MLSLKRKSVIIVVVIFIAAAATFGVWLLLSSFCEYNYTIELRRLPDAERPARFVSLDPGDLEMYPLIGQVLDAYENPSAHSGARFRGETLLFPVLTASGDRTVVSTNDFLSDRSGGRSVVITVDNATFYTWALVVVDPGYFGPCR